MLRKLARSTADLLYPLRCAGCGRFETVLCDSCQAKLLPATGPGRCKFCCAQWPGEDNCPRCMHLQQLEGVRAAVEMSGAARHLVHLLKYRYFEPAAGPMARAMRPLAESLAVDYAFAVPLHRSRLRERGFNQSELLMKGLGLPKGPGTLLRRRKTERQVGSGFRERLKHVAGAFAYEGPRLDGQTVAIVDDVITTGATMAECAAALTDAGARKVWGVAFARASYRLGSDEPIED